MVDKYGGKFYLVLFFAFLFLLLAYVPSSFGGAPPTPTPTPTSCEDPACGPPAADCTGPNGCNDVVPGGCQWCEDDLMCISASGQCPSASPTPTPTPPPSVPTYHQVGGSVMGTSNTIMCCSFYSDVCAPCGNPAQGFSYQTPNACDNALDYENLWLKCKDPKCNKLTKGSYNIQICHLDGTTDPSDGTGTEVCTQNQDCIIDRYNNHCDFNDYTDQVEEGETIYLKITPSKGPAPNAPLKALWTGLVNSCTFPYCGDGKISGLEQCEGSDLNGTQCTDLPNPDSGNYAGGELACASDCTFDTGGCYYCGDGNLNPGELCDDGANNGPDKACSTACEQTYCGDGTVQNPNGSGLGGTTNTGDEECDDGNMDDTDSCINCQNATCGDGFVQSGVEDCDDGNQSNNDDCLNTCVNASCGDGYAWTEGNGNEECDDPEFPNGTDCTSYSGSFCGGSVSCTSCGINTATCQPCSPSCEDDFDCAPDEVCDFGTCVPD